MRDDLLETYLNDHLAGATAAVHLLRRCRSHHAEGALGPFFADLLEEIEHDREILRGLFTRIDGDASPAKQAAGWLAEEGSRAKLRDLAPDTLDFLEALDGLSAGIEGKRALWTALGATYAPDPRFHGVDFAALTQRAERQHAQVEAQRIEAAQRVFGAEGVSVPPRRP
jgi:hypothetical protein